MIPLKWIKSWLNFCCRRKFYARIALKTARIYFSACKLLTNHHKRVKNFKETGDLNYIYENDPDSKDLAKKTVSDTVLKDTT